jgi:hypothetical protein
MARIIVSVPASLCRVTGFTWQIDWRTQPTAEATDGNSQIMNVGFPRWIGTLPLILRPADVLQWRAVHAQARGRLGLYRITMTDVLVPVPQDGRPWDNGEPWEGGALWEGEPFWTVETAAAAGATELRVTIPTDMPEPVVGQIVSHQDWPTHVVEALEDAGVWTLRISRPLPVAAAAEDQIELRAKGIFEAVDDMTGNPAYDLNRVASFSMSFREYLRR